MTIDHEATLSDTDIAGCADQLGRKTIRTAAGRTLSYIDAGSGPDVILLHGTLTTLDDMRLSVFDDLSRDFHVVALDRPSHGASDRVPGTDASLWSQAAIVHDAAEALGFERPIVCGHSYGAAVALAYGMAFPDDSSGVVALAPICFPEPRLEHVLFGPRALPPPSGALARIFGDTIDTMVLPLLWRAMFLPQQMPAHFAAEFPFGLAGDTAQVNAEGEGANALWLDLARSVAGYAGCRVPVRFVVGMADLVVNPFLQSALASTLIPGARIDLLPGVGHMLHHARPDAVVDAIRAIAAGRTDIGGDAKGHA